MTLYLIKQTDQSHIAVFRHGKDRQKKKKESLQENGSCKTGGKFLAMLLPPDRIKPTSRPSDGGARHQRLKLLLSLLKQRLVLCELCELLWSSYPRIHLTTV